MALVNPLPDSALRPAQLSDAHAIACIHVTAWQVAYRGIVPDSYLSGMQIERYTERWRLRIGKAESEIWLVEIHQAPAGWIAFGPSRDQGARSESAEIYAAYVAPDCWSLGIGQALMRGATARLEGNGYASCHLWVLEQNLRARKFYERAGFTPQRGPGMTVTIGTVPLPQIRYERPLGNTVVSGGNIGP